MKIITEIVMVPLEIKKYIFVLLIRHMDNSDLIKKTYIT